ncbi:MAG: hypothetical protein H7Y31_15910 [Chitinophagaceae bacterium]|nr:hypothetical protein [Chitinophagaceae bacterium]
MEIQNEPSVILPKPGKKRRRISTVLIIELVGLLFGAIVIFYTRETFKETQRSVNISAAAFADARQKDSMLRAYDDLAKHPYLQMRIDSFWTMARVRPSMEYPRAKQLFVKMTLENLTNNPTQIEAFNMRAKLHQDSSQFPGVPLPNKYQGRFLESEYLMANKPIQTIVIAQYDSLNTPMTDYESFLILFEVKYLNLLTNQRRSYTYQVIADLFFNGSKTAITTLVNKNHTDTLAANE